MFGRRKATAKRFSLLLLEEEEDYVKDFVARCRCVFTCVCVCVLLEGEEDYVEDFVARCRCDYVCCDKAECSEINYGSLTPTHCQLCACKPSDPVIPELCLGQNACCSPGGY